MRRAGAGWTRAAGQGEESYCGCTYSHTSVGEPDDAFDVTATLRYEVTWTCSGVCIADAGTLDELVTSPTQSVAYPVTERQTVVVNNPPGYD